MGGIETIRNATPEVAKDIKLNLQAVLQDGALTADQRWGVAVTSAVTARNEPLLDAVLADARREVGQAVIDDAFAAAALMAMNNVYYRSRHFVEKSIYSQKPPRLRMNRLVKPATSKVDFELFCLATSAINGCETCVRAHEKVVVEGGLSEEAVHDAIRIAATFHAAAVSLELPPIVIEASAEEASAV